MADFSSVPAVELLTRAADAAGQAAAIDWPGVYGLIRRDGWREEIETVLLASGPDHWRAVEATFRDAAGLFERLDADGATTYASHLERCLRDLAEQVLQDLGDTDG